MEEKLQPVTLEDIVISEQRLCEILGVERKVLDMVRREKGLPCVYLDSRHRVYLTGHILEWLEKHKTTL